MSFHLEIGGFVSVFFLDHSVDEGVKLPGSGDGISDELAQLLGLRSGVHLHGGHQELEQFALENPVKIRKNINIIKKLKLYF